MNLQLEYLKKRDEIVKRLQEFEKNKNYFYELCFCLLTPQTKARNADLVIKQLKALDFKNKSFSPVKYLIGIRFHENKAKYLLELKEKFDKIPFNLSSRELREYLVKNIKGLGYKEASHYLRNIGHKDLAILDRHILSNLKYFDVINEVPKSMTKKQYLEIEDKFLDFSKKVNIPIDHLDLLFWSSKTGEIFK
ncbi:MAG: N-glycosylase/DNA lyase [Candidatus Woesearchaeota archaeon]|nr:N-glycosylase/DNA lyase [Candidatus Woesearchaeota archaeon]